MIDKKCNFLILEDDEKRMKEFVLRFGTLRYKTGYNHYVKIVTNVDDCKKELNTGIYDYLLLDHDLDGRHYVPTYEYNTGSEVARYIHSNADAFKLLKIYTHTFNEIGAKYILSMVDANYHPGIWMFDFFSEIFN